MERNATVTWKGPLKEGKGLINTRSRALHDLPFNFGMRFKDEVGTNPEELIAAAHAACFSMALSGALEKEGFKEVDIHTTVTVSLQNKNDEWSISTSHIDVGAEVPDISEEKFQQIAEKTKATCPVSRVLNAEISLNAKLWTNEKMKSTQRPLPGEL